LIASAAHLVARRGTRVRMADILFDPRKIFDLIATAGMPQEIAGHRPVFASCRAMKA
jgi:hypothetical protein